MLVIYIQQENSRPGLQMHLYSFTHKPQILTIIGFHLELTYWGNHEMLPRKEKTYKKY